MYFHRDIETELREALGQFPAVLVTGPRQAGKSTLLLECLGEYNYATLDDPETQALAIRDPQLFLSLNEPPLVIDEIQYAPQLLAYLKLRIDADRHLHGQYVITGSQTFQMMQGVTETLAGRIAIFQLFPFSWSEIGKIKGHEQSANNERATLDQIVQGFYPEFFQTPGINWNRWFSSYVLTYLERDVRNVKSIGDLSRFQTFLSLLATRAGSLLNLTEIGKECGISAPTAKEWLTILQATYVIHLLRPYHRNRSKRLIKSPKVYFVDTGLLCYLLGIDNSDRLLRASERGNIFENMIVMEALKRAAISQHKEELFFYRTNAGHEVDLLVERAGALSAYEIKLSKTPNPNMAESIQRFATEHPNATCKLLCLRESELPLTREVSAVHWSEIVSPS